MPEIPKGVYDLGVTAVALFLFVAAIYLVLLIVKAVKGQAGSDKATGMNGHVRPPCLNSPAFSLIGTNQTIILDHLREIRVVNQKLTENSILQTQLMERVATVQEEIGKCMTKIDARDEYAARGHA